MKKTILLLVICLLLTGCKLFIRPNIYEEYLEGIHKIEIKVKDYGIIKASLLSFAVKMRRTLYSKGFLVF